MQNEWTLNEKEDFRRGMNLGADDYITKPFYKDELLQVIGKIHSYVITTNTLIPITNWRQG